MFLTDTGVRWCLKLYSLYVKDGFIKRGFRSLHDLGQRLESSLNPSTTVRVLLKELFEEGVLVERDGLIVLDKKRFSEIYEATEFYNLVSDYEDDTQAIRFG